VIVSAVFGDFELYRGSSGVRS